MPPPYLLTDAIELVSLKPKRFNAVINPVCKLLNVSIPPQLIPKSTTVSATASEIPVTMLRTSLYLVLLHDTSELTRQVVEILCRFLRLPRSR